MGSGNTPWRRPQAVLWVGGAIGIVAWLVVIALLTVGLGWFAFLIAACVAVLLAERVSAVRGLNRLDTIGAAFAAFMVTSPVMLFVLLGVLTWATGFRWQ